MSEEIQTRQRRPVGVTVMALISLVQGALWLVFVLGVLGLGGILGALAGPAGMVLGSGMALFMTFTRLLAALLHIWFGVGALKLKKSAWWIGVLAPAISIAGAFVDVGAGDAALGPKLASIALPALMLLYLLSPGVRGEFRN
jgi:hypothetical protein